MRILVIDLELSPCLADVWGLWDQNIAINQIRAASEIMCFAAKWKGEKEIFFYSDYNDGKDKMIEKAHGLLDCADAIIHYNGKRYDTPHFNREFLLAGLAPPSPYHQIDLLETVKKKFNFPSNKLQYVVQALNIGSKVEHMGHELWIKCLDFQPKAWKLMEKYNKQDVVLTEKLYDRLLPWIPSHPSFGAFEGKDVCPTCGSEKLERRGFATTNQGMFQRFHCVCGKWSRSSSKLAGTKIVSIAT